MGAEEQDILDPDDFLADLSKFHARSKKAVHLNAKDEIVRNIVPMFESVGLMIRELYDHVFGDDEDTVKLAQDARAVAVLGDAAVALLLQELGGLEKVSDLGKEHVRAYRMASQTLLAETDSLVANEDDAEDDDDEEEEATPDGGGDDESDEPGEEDGDEEDDDDGDEEDDDEEEDEDASESETGDQP